MTGSQDHKNHYLVACRKKPKKIFLAFWMQRGSDINNVVPESSPSVPMSLLTLTSSSSTPKLLFFLSDGEIFPAMLLRVSLLLLNFWWFSACLCFLAEFRRMGWVFLDPGPLSPFPVPTPGAVQHCSSAVPPAAVAGGQSHPREGCCVET